MREDVKSSKCFILFALYCVYVYLCVAVVESYKLSGRHTFLGAGVTTGCLITLFICLLILYKHLGPYKHLDADLSNGGPKTTSCTSKLLGV